MKSKEPARELQARLHKAFIYDPASGAFLHRANGVHKTAMANAASKNKITGYMTLRFDGGNVYAHRMAWVYLYGEYPDRIDHINGDRADNRIANLRSVTQSGNLQNLTNRPQRSNPYLGVSQCKKTGRFEAYIQIQGRKKSLGRHATPEEAHQAYLSAKKVFHTVNPVPREVVL